VNTDVVHFPSKQVLNTARNMVNDFYARDFDDELEARDFDSELEALSRRFNNELEARGHHW
jgi:hypothetical protein